MKVLILSGSPRKKGNTARVTGALIERLGKETEVENIHCAEGNIQPCRGCYACQKDSSFPECVHRDDFDRIYEKMAGADWIIYATPVYAWGFTAQMKPLIDRQVSLVKWIDGEPRRLLEGKSSLLIATCAGKKEENADLLGEIYRRESRYLGLRARGVFAVGDFDVSGADHKKIEDTVSRILQLMEGGPSPRKRSPSPWSG